ncbi:MAG TPA: ABC transporter permease [Thermoanaerobaculia bacterium]|nr:ABC transporter permease [Thermoanaerobaculia bacterium]
MRRDVYLLQELVRRDFEARYAGSLLGFLWSFVAPLWQLLLLSFVFSTVMRIPLTGQRTSSFAVFLFCGLLPWTALQEGVLRGSTAITDNASLVKKLRFPSQLLVLAVVLAALIHEAIAALLFAGLLALKGELALASLPLLLIAIPLQVSLTVGLGLVLSATHVFFRDTAQVLGMAFAGWFYVTPIVYPLELVPERFRVWVEHNPLTALVALYRRAFLGPNQQPIPGLGALVLAALVALAVGSWLFGRLKPAFVDEI